MKYTPEERERMNAWEVPTKEELFIVYRRLTKEERDGKKSAYEQMLADMTQADYIIHQGYDATNVLEMKILLEKLEILAQIEIDGR